MLSRLFPLSFRNWCYRFGYERGYLDTLLDTWIVSPFMLFFRWSDSMERRWTDWISNEPSRESDNIEIHPEETEKAA